MGLKVEANIMAQIVENVPPKDYLKEGEKIMKDAFQLLAQIKQRDLSIKTPRHRRDKSSGLKSKHDSPEAPDSPDQLMKLERKFLKIEKRLQ